MLIENDVLYGSLFHISFVLNYTCLSTSIEVSQCSEMRTEGGVEWQYRGNPRPKWKVCHAIAICCLLHYLSLLYIQSCIQQYVSSFSIIDIADVFIVSLSSWISDLVGVPMMDPKGSPEPLASSSHQQHSSEHPTMSTHPQHIDLQALHSRKSMKRSQASKSTSFCIPGCTHEKI